MPYLEVASLNYISPNAQSMDNPKELQSAWRDMLRSCMDSCQELSAELTMVLPSHMEVKSPCSTWRCCMPHDALHPWPWSSPILLPGFCQEQRAISRTLTFHSLMWQSRGKQWSWGRCGEEGTGWGPTRQEVTAGWKPAKKLSLDCGKIIGGATAGKPRLQVLTSWMPLCPFLLHLLNTSGKKIFLRISGWQT